MCLVLGAGRVRGCIFCGRSDWLLVSGELHLPPPVCREETPLHSMTWLSLSDNGGSPAVGCASESCLCTSGGEHVHVAVRGTAGGAFVACHGRRLRSPGSQRLPVPAWLPDYVVVSNFLHG